jgi:uncharacterized repeat protein (TIGR03843 family)
MAEGMDFGEAEHLLCEAHFGDLQAVWNSSNYVFVATMHAPGGREFAAIYKPARGEAPLWDFPAHSLYRRETAAYRLSQLLGWPFVPPTVVREEGPHGPGSLQLFIAHDPHKHFFEQRDQPDFVPQLQRMCLFDWLANNADRKGGHCLLDGDGRIWGIDHGLCFHAQDKLRSVIWDWAGDEIPGEWLDEVAAAREAIAGRSPQALALLELLDPDEPGPLGRRMDRALKLRRFPTPGASRHYPWPLV